MRKVLHDNRLRASSPVRTGRPAFSLAELIVSIAILMLMMSLAGQVFSFTVKSTGQATALTELSQRLRAFEDTLREDLRHVDPESSFILIQGNPVNAYWTQDDLEANPGQNAALGWYPHVAQPNREDENGNLLSPRADILMFYSARKGSSYLDPKITSNLQQVVYGHADLGEYVSTGAGPGLYSFELTSGVTSNFPTMIVAGNPYPSQEVPAMTAAQRWHLARRSTLLLPTPAPPGIGLNPPLAAADLEMLRLGELDAIGEFSTGTKRSYFEHSVLMPDLTAPPWYLPKVLDGYLEHPPYGRSLLDPTPPPLYADRLGHYALPGCASFKVEWSLDPRCEYVAGRLDNLNEILWFDPGDPGDPNDPLDPPDPLRSLAEAIERETDNIKRGALEDLLTEPSTDGSVYPNPAETPIKYSLADRFRGAARPDADPDYAWPNLAADELRANLVVFTASRPGPTDNSGLNTLVPDAVYPKALRITVDVYDEERRLDRPVRHVMIIPIGG